MPPRPLRHSCHYFFFSSRRRHTRSLRDWSSDVCSSDLLGFLYDWPVDSKPSVAMIFKTGKSAAVPLRSEERRVGKSVDLGGRGIVKKKKRERGVGFAVGERVGVAGVVVRVVGGSLRVWV